MNGSLVAPVVALVGWTLLMQLWMVATRIPAMRARGIVLKGMRGGQGRQLDGILPDKTQWVAHNYNHLMEQPTIFYALVLALAVAGAATPLNVALAWGYVASRVAHSLIQATSNIVSYRFGMFFVGSLLLIALAVSGAAALVSG